MLIFPASDIASAAPLKPSLTLVGEANATAATFSVTPSANSGGLQVNYTIWYRMVGKTFQPFHVPIVDKNPTLTQLLPNTQYNVFVEARNHLGSANSTAIRVLTKQES